MEIYYFETTNHKKDCGIFLSKKDFSTYLKANNMKILNYKIKNKNYKISNKELIEITDFLILLIESGIEFQESLDIIINQVQNKLVRSILYNIKINIDNGSSIYGAFNKYRKVFPDTYLTLIESGELTNNILENLKRAYENMQIVKSFNEKIKKALYYPIIVLFFMMVVFIFLFSYVLPNFEDFFDEIDLPEITRLLLYISHNFWYIFGGFLSVILVGVFSYRHLSPNQKFKFLFHIPIIKEILRQIMVINISQNIYILSKSRMNFNSIMERLIGKWEFADKYFMQAKHDIDNGQSCETAFKKIPFFNREEINLINIGEIRGDLPMSFERIFIITQKKLDDKLFKMSVIFQPIVIAILGIIIVGIMFAIYLPIFNLSESII